MSYYIVTTLYKGDYLWTLILYHKNQRINTLSFIIMNISSMKWSVPVLKIKVLDVILVILNLFKMSSILPVLLFPVSILWLRMPLLLSEMPVSMNILNFPLWLLLKKDLRIIRLLKHSENGCPDWNRFEKHIMPSSNDNAAYQLYPINNEGDHTKWKCRSSSMHQQQKMIIYMLNRILASWSNEIVKRWKACIFDGIIFHLFFLHDLQHYSDMTVTKGKRKEPHPITGRSFFPWFLSD